MGRLRRFTGSLIGNENPSAVLDTAYFGCDDGDTNISICSNDNSGSATCASLGDSFPCTTDGAYYDFWLSAQPNGGSINYFIERLDSAATATGNMTSDLPRNTVQMNWKTGLNTGGTTATAVVLGFHGVCLVSNL